MSACPAQPQECEFLSTCGFFRKYKDIKDLACRGFIATYCKGERQAACQRKAYREEHGKQPVEDMMPNGKLMADLGDLLKA